MIEGTSQFFAHTPVYLLPSTSQFIKLGVYGLYYIGNLTFQTTSLLPHGTLQKRYVSEDKLHLMVTNAAITSSISRHWKAYWQGEAM